MFDDDRRTPAEIRQAIREDRANSVNRNLNRPNTPQRHPRDVRAEFHRQGLRGPDHNSRN